MVAEIKQGENHDKQDGKFMKHVVEKAGTRVGMVDVVRRLQTRVDQREPHGQPGGVFYIVDAVVFPGKKIKARFIVMHEAGFY